jgi:hypothetical protein
MATSFDDMTGVSTDRFYTFDDPMFNARLDAAYATGVIVRDGPALTLDQSSSGVVTDGFDTTVVRDTFQRTAVGSGWGTPTLKIPGQSWTAPSQLTTDGTYGLVVPAATNTIYFATLAGLSDVNFDFAVLVRPMVFFTGAKGSVYLFARFTDFNNCLRFRVDFNIDQIIGYGIESVLAGTPSTITSGLIQSFNQVANQFYWIRVQGNGSTIKLKVWSYGSAQPDEWATTKTDAQWFNTAGTIGTGFLVGTGNTNTLSVPIVQYAMFWAGLQKVLDNAGVTSGLSLDDGLPSGASNTDTQGGGQAGATLLAPIGEEATLYYSPFRDDKPFGGFQDRDVATVALSTGAVTDEGVKTVRFFTGQMSDIPIDGDTAKLTAVSRTRLKMSTFIQPPAIHGVFEGCELTWAVAYALYKSGVQNVPPTLPGIRHYSPMNGSTHCFVPDANSGPFSFSSVFRFPPGVSQWAKPTFIDGPYLGTAALDAEISKNRTLKWTSQGNNMPIGPGDDLYSQTAAKGRIEFWVKTTAYDVLGSPDPAALFMAWFSVQNPAGTRYIRLFIPADTRIPGVNLNDGTTGITFPNVSGDIPVDNGWHFVACSWDFPGNNIRITWDGNTTSYGLSGLSQSALPVVDDVTQIQASGYWPIAELRVTSGLLSPQSKSQWVRDASWSRDSIVRRSVINIDGLAITAPREAYEFVGAIARSELAKTGFDAQDNFLYLSMPYWAELAQQMPLEVLSTATNLGPDFKPFRDVTKIYNQIRISYNALTVQEIWVSVFSASNLIAIPVGYSNLIVPLSAPAIEMRNIAAGLSVLSGAALAAAPPSDANAINYITANTATDGSGTYATAANLVVGVLAWDPGSATLAFNNMTGTILYIANNVNIASMGLAAKVLVGGTQSIISSSLIGQTPLRGTRVLPVDSGMEFIQNAHDAGAIGAELASRLGYPRTIVTSSVWGDPRRAPGQVYTLADADRTKITGPFRLLSVQNQQNGPDFGQQLVLEQALPIAQWDTATWDNVIWGP